VKLQIEIDVDDRDVDKKRLEADLHREAVLHLFADRKIPAGRATRLLGTTRVEFMDLLKQRSISHTDYTAADFAEDMDTIERLKPEIERNVEELVCPGLPIALDCGSAGRRCYFQPRQ
jgi:predicted HTH domain antitoxin